MPRAAREALMIEVGTRTFAEHGYHASSMEEIAEGAGVTKPMLYAYFGSKEGLFVACMESINRPLLSAIGVDRSDLPADQQLWEGIKSFCAFVDENRDVWSRIYLDAPAVGGQAAEAAERARAATVRVLAQLIANAVESEGIPPEEGSGIEPISHAFVGAAEAISRWWLDHPDEPLESVSAQLMNFAWQGFGRLIKSEFWVEPCPD